MSSLFQFRVARPPQRRASITSPLLILSPLSRFDIAEKISGLSSRVTPTMALSILDSNLNSLSGRSPLFEYLVQFSPLANGLNALDKFLITNRNAPEASESFWTITSEIVHWIENWWALRESLSSLLSEELLESTGSEIFDSLTRLPIFMGLVELYAEDPNQLEIPEQIHSAIRWRLLFLPMDLVLIRLQSV